MELLRKSAARMGILLRLEGPRSFVETKRLTDPLQFEVRRAEKFCGTGDAPRLVAKPVSGAAFSRDMAR
jgi:hypothetical protein